MFKTLVSTLILVLNLLTILMLAACGGGGGSAVPAGDTTPPVIIRTSPVSGKYTTTNITIDIKFNEDIQIPDSTKVDIFPFLANGSLNTAKPVFLKSPPFAKDPGSNELNIRPVTNGASDNALQTDTRYHVYIHGVKDIAGNSMKECRFEFATGNYNGAIVTSSKPCDTPQPVSLNGQFEFAQSSSSISEGNSGTKTHSITVYRTGGSDGSVTVAFELVNGSGVTGAILNTDYNASPSSSSGILTFAKGITSKTINVDIIGDTTPEENKTFNITLSNATGGASINSQNNSHTVIIRNDDFATSAPGTFGFEKTTSSVSETVFVNQIESGNEVVINVIRNGGNSGRLEVGYSTTDGTANATADYTAPINGVLVFNDLETLKSIRIPILKDGLYEPTPETFTVTIIIINGSVIEATKNTHEVSIVSNDPKPLSKIGFSFPASSIDENLGPALIAVTRTPPIDTTASVEFFTESQPGLSTAATPGNDYAQITGTLNFAAGSKISTPSDISIAITPDKLKEPRETFLVKLQKPIGGELGINTQVHEVTINDTSVILPGTIGFTTNTVETISEASGNVVISVSRIDGTSGSLTANYSTTPGTATSPGDFTASSDVITFADGKGGTQTISIPIINDNKVDNPANKDFTVTLSGAAVGTNKTKTVTIIDAGVSRPLTTAQLVAIWSLLL